MFDETFKRRFNAKWVIDETSGCWLWTASCAGQMGYGQIKLPRQRRQEYAHRVAYIIHKGYIPEGKMILHHCDNPKCINPEHLFIGTSSENHLDMKTKGRHLYGERNNQAKLTMEEVRQIYSMLDLGISQQKIGKTFGIAQASVSKIKRHVRWKHLKI